MCDAPPPAAAQPAPLAIDPNADFCRLKVKHTEYLDNYKGPCSMYAPRCDTAAELAVPARPAGKRRADDPADVDPAALCATDWCRCKLLSTEHRDNYKIRCPLKSRRIGAGDDDGTAGRVDARYDWCHCVPVHTEHRDNFRAPPPPRAQASNSRHYHMDRFLRTALTRECVERMLGAELRAQNERRRTSEYAEHFTRPTVDRSDADASLQRSYPLYGTSAITFWSPLVARDSQFNLGRSGCTLKPISECYDQQFQ